MRATCDRAGGCRIAQQFFQDHIQTVSSRYSQIKGFLRGFRGIASKYLDSYLRWCHLIELADQPSPKACLKAAMDKPSLRFAN